MIQPIYKEIADMEEHLADVQSRIDLMDSEIDRYIRLQRQIRFAYCQLKCMELEKKITDQLMVAFRNLEMAIPE